MNRYSFKSAVQNIKRSGWRAYAVIFMMTVTFLILGFLLTVIYASNSIAQEFIRKPEVIGFFKDDVTEEQILEVKRELELKDYVAEVKYVSREDAMETFLEQNKENQEVIEAVTANVLPAHLNVKSTSLDRIPDIATYFRENELISEVLALENVLDTIRKVVLGIQIVAFTLLAIFTISTIFIIFLTIGITVYSQKQEIIVMKLVGASDSYVRAPYLIQSLIFTLFSIVIASIVLIPVLLWQYSRVMRLLLGDLNVPGLTFTTTLLGMLIMIVFGFLLALFSSFFATRRYIDY